MNNKQTGFTLIEVMIVVGIIGIITAIAFPSYTQYVRKAKRTDAKVELLRIAQLQESFFVQNLSYASSLDANSATIGGLGLGATVKSEQEEYTITIDSVVPGGCTGISGSACTGYTLLAVGNGVQAYDTTCGNFTLSNTGAKTVSGSETVENCWK